MSPEPALLLTDQEKQSLSNLATLAAAHPQDLRSPDPAMLRNLCLDIRSLRVAFSHDRMPPDGRPYMHLSVSENGKLPGDADFLSIAEAVGIGAPSTWHPELTVAFAKLPMLTARHAFKARST